MLCAGDLGRAKEGAVAPIVGISLFALVAAGGLGFDYARMAGLNTELQTAADQAALAAATQLDGRPGAQTRATSAAQNLVTNNTNFANDGQARAITVPTIAFYQDQAKATVATNDANAHFVLVTVGARRAYFALTPLVAMFQSGPLTTQAFAGVGTAICKVPPVMICNPDEPAGNTNVYYDFNAAGRVGAGVRLVAAGGSGSWAPGNFGYLETGLGNGANGLRKALGWLNLPTDCLPQTGVNTKPGQNASVNDALNTRFDIYANGQSCPSGGTCPPSRNTVKDLIRPSGNGNNSCTIGNKGWQESATPYLPTSATVPLTAAQMPAAIGYPRDMCHAISMNGSCADDRVGDGLWDRNAYFYVNYGASYNWQVAMTAAGYNPATLTRYQVYQWEMAQASHIDAPRTVSGNLTSYGAPVCWAGTPSNGITPGGQTVDRRRISTAVVNCGAAGINGSSTNVPVTKWVDLFLVEPSASRARTTDKDIYAEIIGETGSGTAGATAPQVVYRATPYLIE